MSPVRLRRNRHHVDDEDNDDENEVAVRYIPFTRSSKRPANVFKIHVLIAGRLLDRVNTLLSFENKTVVLMRYLTSYKVYTGCGRKK